MDFLTNDWPMNMLSVAIGLGLSAACGFRVFLPFAAIGLASMTGYLPLSPEFAWLGQWPALILFCTATVVEVVAYYVPWLDNLLDTIATPAAILAGAVAALAVLVDMPPEIKWTVAAIAGTTAGTVQAGSVLTRALSSAASGGLANPLVASAELGGTVIMSLLAILLPPIALLVVLILLIVVISRLFRRRFRRRKGAEPAT